MIFNLNKFNVVSKSKAESKPKKVVVEKQIEGFIDIDDDENLTFLYRNVNYPIIKESYSHKGRKVLFHKDLIPFRGSYTHRAIVRNGSECEYYMKNYLPFRPGLRVKGKIIKRLGIECFELTSILDSFHSKEIFDKWKIIYERKINR